MVPATEPMRDDDEDHALLRAHQRGDARAFGVLAQRHERRLWNFLRRLLGDAHAAEDLLQETFARALAAAPTWRPEARVSTFLYTIARNLAADQARRAVHRNALSLDAGGGADEAEPAPRARLGERVAAPQPSAERVTLNREIAMRIESAVASLPPEQREVFLMRETMDMSFAEIAGAVGVSEATIKSRMRYALERLRTSLNELRDTGERPVVAAAPGGGS